MFSQSPFWALLVLSFCLPAWAQVYQWRDAEGKLHFTDTPPPESQKVEEQRLQVNTVQGMSEQELERDKPAEDDEELNPGQLQQKGVIQCSAAIARMPSLIAETQKLGREAVRDGKVTQRRLDEAMTKMDDAYMHMKRNERECVAEYTAGGKSRLAVDCLADTEDVMSFGLCMQFAEWAETFGG